MKRTRSASASGAPALKRARPAERDACGTGQEAARERAAQRRGDLPPEQVAPGQGGAPPACDMVAGGVFDPTTGALSRPFDSFRPPTAPRGYGATPELDSHPFLKPGVTLVIAPTGGGKTTLKLNLVDEILAHADHDRLGKLMWYSGSPQDDLLKKLDRETVQFYGPSDTEHLLGDLRKLHLDMLGDGRESSKPYNVLVLDDAGNNQQLTPSNTKGSDIGDTFVQHRHLGMHVIASAQRFKMLPPFLRNNASHLFMFPGRARGEVEEVFKNVDLPRERLEQAYKMMADDPHQFLWLDLPRRTAKIGFNRVILR